MNKIKGFSLIEIMIVVSIISIITLIAVPNYSKYIQYANVQRAQNLGKEICLSVINSEIINQDFKNQGVMEDNVKDEINTFTESYEIQNTIIVEHSQNSKGEIIVSVKYSLDKKSYKVCINLSNSKYNIYVLNGEKYELLYNDF